MFALYRRDMYRASDAELKENLIAVDEHFAPLHELAKKYHEGAAIHTLRDGLIQENELHLWKLPVTTNTTL